MNPSEMADMWLSLLDEKDQKQFISKSKVISNWQRKYTAKEWGLFAELIKKEKQ